MIGWTEGWDGGRALEWRVFIFIFLLFFLFFFVHASENSTPTSSGFSPGSPVIVGEAILLLYGAHYPPTFLDQ